jgi:AcrR family transcriptional regulator
MCRCSLTNAGWPVSDTTTARQRAPRGRGAELRGEVLQAAMDLLTETGDESAVSVRGVAQRVGVSVPSIYLHFADKQALIDAVCQEVFEQLHVRLREAGEAGDDPFDALRRQGNAYVRFAVDHPEHYRLVMMTSHARTPEAPDALIASGAFGYLVASVEKCLEVGIFEGPPVELGLGLWAAAHGVASLLVAKPYFPWPDRDAFIDRTICMAGIGLAAAARFDADNDLPVEQVVATLDRLRS